jgi:hypothetical protein
MEVFYGLLGAVLGAVLGAFAGAIATYVTTRSTMQLQSELTYDKELRDIRLPHYQRLFHISRRIPRPGFYKKVPTRQDLLGFREEFHDWYFGEGAGGMFLPEVTRRLYFRLMDKLVLMAEEKDTKESSAQSPLTSDEHQALYELASDLRHQLSGDLGAAQPPRFPGIPLDQTSPPPSELSTQAREGGLEQQRSR